MDQSYNIHLVGLTSHHVHTVNKPLWSSPPPKSLGAFVLVRTQVRLLYSHLHKHTAPKGKMSLI